jgi:hypothetical protein
MHGQQNIKFFKSLVGTSWFGVSNFRIRRGTFRAHGMSLKAPSSERYVLRLLAERRQ